MSLSLLSLSLVAFIAPGGAPGAAPAPAPATVPATTTAAPSLPAPDPAAGVAAPAVQPAAPAAQAANIDVVNGTIGYRSQTGASQISIYQGGKLVSSANTPCPISAMQVHEGFLYVGCSDGQLHLFAVSGANANAPQHATSYQYPNPIRGFLVDQGQISIDAPSAAPPAPATVGAPVSAIPAATPRPGARPRPAPRPSDSRRLLHRGRALAIPGFIAFGVTYLGFALVASGFENDRVYAVPVIGPWIHAPNSMNPGVDIVGGLVQAGGLTMGIFGVRKIRQWKKGVRLTSMPMRHGSGLMLSGRF